MKDKWTYRDKIKQIPVRQALLFEGLKWQDLIQYLTLNEIPDDVNQKVD